MIIAIHCCCVATAAAESNWPRWRGAGANGQAREKGLPHQWSDDSITWKTALPGRGNSSPTIWGERIFLTSAIDQGRQRVVMCLDRNNGRILWQNVAWNGNPEPAHERNGWASSTCATDGQFVYAFFGRGGGLHCYRLDGKHVWSRNLGTFVGPWGTAASPLIFGGLVIQNCDADENACIVALDKETGDEVWKTDRPNHRGWSSPVLMHGEKRDEIVVNGHTGVFAYAPESGRQLWFCACQKGRGSPTVTPADGLLFVVNGLRGGGVYCIRPGGIGDVTETGRVWFTPRGGRDLSSPVIVGDMVLVMSLRGAILTGYHKHSGVELWRIRTGGEVSASPISYDGLAFFISLSGKTVVVEPQSAKVIATNSITAPIDEYFRSSLTPSEGQIFIRSDRNLYCVGTREKNFE